MDTIKVNLASGTQRVSGKLSISQSSVVHPLRNFGKNIWNLWIVTHVAKILQNFWLAYYLKQLNNFNAVIIHIVLILFYLTYL